MASLGFVYKIAKPPIYLFFIWKGTMYIIYIHTNVNAQQASCFGKKKGIHHYN